MNWKSPFIAVALAVRIAQANPFFAMDTAVRDLKELDTVKSLGYDGIGWKVGPPAELSAAVAEVQRRRLKLFAVYSYQYALLTATNLALPPELEAAMKNLEGTGAVIWLPINSSVFKSSSAAGDSIAAPALQKLADDAALHGLRVAIYPHQGCWTERVQDAVRVAKAVNRKNFGVTFNLCHSLMVGDEAKIPALLADAAPYLFLVTINGADGGKPNSSWNELIRPLDEGSFDLRGVLHTLEELRYTGPIGLQGYGLKIPATENLVRSMVAWRRLNSSLSDGVSTSAMATLANAATPDFQSPYLAVGFERGSPEFSCFTLDSLGKNSLGNNPVLRSTPVGLSACYTRLATNRFGWAISNTLAWEVVCSNAAIILRSKAALIATLPPFVLQFNQKANHATLLGMMRPDDRRVALPCVLHMPDCGSARITCTVPGAALSYDARRRRVPNAFVRIEFPPATAEHPLVEYRLEVAAIYPRLPPIAGDARFDGFRRDFLNIFQLNPRVQMLANNAASDPCSFTLFMYSEVARHAPPLADGLTCLDLVRMTLDRYLSGAKGYGQVGYACGPVDADLVAWQTPWTTLDTYPSFLIAACNYAEGAQDWKWAENNYPALRAWGREMLATTTNGNDLVVYPGSGNLNDRPRVDRRPSNWWDTINFGHEDAYANALTFHACQRFAALAQRLGQAEDAGFFKAKAVKLRAAYLPAFLNPKTGLLAGWRSADGTLHDYYFTFVQGVAISYGLVDAAPANAIMDALLAKMRQVGYTNFAIGLPGNLVAIRKGDYVLQDSPPTRFGVPALEDGSDGFGYYENGGATSCFSWFTVKALYQLGRRADAERIFLPMLAGYAAGNFQGFDASGQSRDWRDWKGRGHGYEGLLVDNYLALLAVFDEVGVIR